MTVQVVADHVVESVLPERALMRLRHALPIDLVRYQTYYRTVIQVNIQDAKTHLSRYLEAVLAGEVVVICRRNVPIAELRGLPTRPKKRRPVGLDADKIEIPDAFFDPLPDDLLDAFDGGRE